MGSRTRYYLALMIAACLVVFAAGAGADLAGDIPEPVYKPLRPLKKPLDPGSIPDPFLSYLVKRGQQATVKAQEEKQQQLAAEERLKTEKQLAAEKLKDLLTARTELQRVPLDKLTLTAIVRAPGKAWAMVRDPQGRGFVLKKGTRIGTNGGVVETIAANQKKVIIMEPYLEKELYVKYRSVEIKLPEMVYE